MRNLGIGCFVVLSGCYLSHGLEPRDGGLPDAPLACEFSFENNSGESVACVIEAGAATPCTEAAACVCAAWHRGEPPEAIEECTRWELTPRALTTLADFCTLTPPARVMMSEALEGYLPIRTGAVLHTSEGCDVMPAIADHF